MRKLASTALLLVQSPILHHHWIYPCVFQGQYHKLTIFGLPSTFFLLKECFFLHISLTPKLESKIKSKVNSGLYNNASEVIREALRFMEENEEIVQQMKLNHLRQAVATGAHQVDDIIANLNNT